MLSDIASELGIVLVLLVANGVFAASELAMVSARRSRLEQQAADGDLRAKKALQLADQPDRLLATVQVGITLIGTFAAAFGGANISKPFAEYLKTVPALAPYADSIAFTVVVLLITYLSLIIGELVPKRLALLHADAIARNLAPLLAWLSWLTRPIVWVLTTSSTLILTLIGQNKQPDSSVTEDDILYMTREGRAGGTVALHEEALISRVFDFSDRTARMLMTPRPDVVAVSANTPLAEITRIAVEHGYSRMPVYEGDSLDRAIGTIYIKDVLPSMLGNDQRQLRELVRPPTYVLEHEPVSKMLTLFRRTGSHMALVVDEYGQISGILTLEDVLEELVGDIRDEYDSNEEQTMVKRDDGSWLIDGSESYEVIATRLSIPINDDNDFVTIAGYVLNELHRLPNVGDHVAWDEYDVEVIDMDGRRIDKVLIKKRA